MVESERDLSVSYQKMGDNYLEMGGAKNQERAKEVYKKSLEISEKLAREKGTISSYDDLAVSLYKIAVCPGIELSVKKQFLEQLLEISKELYQKTGNKKYIEFIATAKRELSTVNHNKTGCLIWPMLIIVLIFLLMILLK